MRKPKHKKRYQNLWRVCTPYLRPTFIAATFAIRQSDMMDNLYAGLIKVVEPAKQSASRSVG